jgi:hypothetical protein
LDEDVVRFPPESAGRVEELFKEPLNGVAAKDDVVELTLELEPPGSLSENIIAFGVTVMDALEGLRFSTTVAKEGVAARRMRLKPLPGKIHRSGDIIRFSPG